MFPNSVANETFSLFILLPETEMAENVGLYLLVYLIVQILTTIANKPFLKQFVSHYSSSDPARPQWNAIQAQLWLNRFNRQLVVEEFVLKFNSVELESLTLNEIAFFALFLCP